MNFRSIKPSSNNFEKAEHDMVLCLDRAQRINRLKERPSFLYQLPYTVAVTKETMRLFPVVSSTCKCAGVPGLQVVDTHGSSFSTDCFLS